MTEEKPILSKPKGSLFIVSGPSGAGKSTIIRKTMTNRRDLSFSISATTRPPRAGELHGREYFFVSRDTFLKMAANFEFLEYAEYVGNLYGTLKTEVNEKLSSGINVILDIDVQGAMMVKSAMPEAVMIFLIPGSFSELERRIRGRNQESEEKIISRLETARREYKSAESYDYIIINDDQTAAVCELLSIISAEGCKTRRRIDQLLMQ